MTASFQLFDDVSSDLYVSTGQVEKEEKQLTNPLAPVRKTSMVVGCVEVNCMRGCLKVSDIF